MSHVACIHPISCWQVSGNLGEAQLPDFLNKPNFAALSAFRPSHKCRSRGPASTRKADGNEQRAAKEMRTTDFGHL